MSRPGRTIVLAAVALLVVAGLLFGRPLVRDRTPVATSVTPPPVAEISPIELPPGEELCADDIALTPRAEVAELVFAQPTDRPPPPLEVRASGPGYASPPARMASGRGGEHAATVAIEPPERELFGRFCATNAGDEPAILVGTAEFGTQTRATTTVAGEEVPADVALKFYEGRQVTLLGYLPELVRRMTILRGPLGATWFVWALLGLVLVAVPGGTLYALYRALRVEAGRI